MSMSCQNARNSVLFGRAWALAHIIYNSNNNSNNNK